MEKMKFLGYLEIQLMTCKETFDKFLELLIKNQSVSSNINEVIRSVLNFLIFFYKKISQVQKSTKPLTANKNKKMCTKKHVSSNINEVIKTI